MYPGGPGILVTGLSQTTRNALCYGVILYVVHLSFYCVDAVSAMLCSVAIY